MIVRVIGAFIAIFAFAMLLETPKKYLWCAGVVGAVGWLVYLIGEKSNAGSILATFISALSIALVSHIFARMFKVPVTVFLIAGILPTVPGAGMYRIVYYIIAGDGRMAGYYLVNTLELAGAIAIAIFIVDSVFRIEWKERRQKKIAEMKKIV